MAHVFISYSKKDIEIARFIRFSLQNAGIPVWMDEHGIGTGDKWINAIESALNDASAMIVLMSQSAKNSDWVNREIQYAEDIGIPIYPVLLNGQAFFRLRDKQYEDMTLGLRGTLSNRFLRQLQNLLPGTQQNVIFRIDNSDVLAAPADVLILKYAGKFYGADWAVSKMLKVAKVAIDMEQLQEQGYTMLETHGAIEARRVLFVATRSLWKFDYADVRSFATKSFQILQREYPEVSSVILTIHGVGAGLDEGEILRAQMGGMLDALKVTQLTKLSQISIAEIDERRCEYLREIAQIYLNEIKLAQPMPEDSDWGYVLAPETQETVSADSDEDTMPSVTIFFPTDDALEDIYYYGILRPVGMQGFLCEKISTQLDTGQTEELEKLQRFIDRAALVIAYVPDDGITPQMGLQIGMALGKGKYVVCVSSQNVEGQANKLLPDDIWLRHTRISDLEETILHLLKSVY
jgi:hypothetical protein